MLLNDIGKSPDATFRRINQHLEANFGFKISEDTSDKDLVFIMEQIEEEITDLKIKGDDARVSPEISKRLLILEGIKTLREFALNQFQSPDFDHVLNGLSDYVSDYFRISGTSHADFEDAICDAMKHYRSSKYRFPDDLVEQRVRSMAMTRIHGEPTTGPLGVNMQTPDLAMVEDDVDEAQSAAATGRHAEREWIADLSGDRPANVSTKAGPSIDSAGPDEQVPMIRDKRTGRMVPDPFLAQTAARRKGILMKENDIEEAVRVFGKAGADQSLRRYGKDSGNPDAQAHRDQTAAMAKQARASGKLTPGRKNRDQMATVEPNSQNPAWSPEKQVMKTRSNEGKGMKEHKNLVKNLRRLLETEVSQAEVMMAAKGFAQELQEMVEKIGRLQNEDLPPVTDQMRETYGMDSASAFQTQIYGALQGVMDSLYTAKGQVDDAVSNMAATGQVGASTDMDLPVDDGSADLDVDAGIDPGADADLDNIAADLETSDDFGAAEEEDPLGRAMKTESESHLKRKVLEMQRLVAKARKLREARG